MNNSNQVTINFASSSDVTVTLNSVKRDNPQGNNYAEDDNYDVSYTNIVNASSAEYCARFSFEDKIWFKKSKPCASSVCLRFGSFT